MMYRRLYCGYERQSDNAAQFVYDMPGCQQTINWCCWNREKVHYPLALV